MDFYEPIIQNYLEEILGEDVNSFQYAIMIQLSWAPLRIDPKNPISEVIFGT